MGSPRAFSANFVVRIDEVRLDDAPHPNFYEIIPADAYINIKVNGTVVLPPGEWEVGIVQNLWNDRVTTVYDKGGEIHFSTNTRPLLDSLPRLKGQITEPDIWLDPFGTAVTKRSNTTGADQSYSFSLEGADTPTSPLIIINRDNRCNAKGKITEGLVFAERVLQLVAILVARKGGPTGELFPLAATAGDPYGYMWRLTHGIPRPDFKWRRLPAKSVEMAPPFSLLLPHGPAFSRPFARDFGAKVTFDALKNYEIDCGVRTPRKGDANLWP